MGKRRKDTSGFSVLTGSWQGHPMYAVVDPKGVTHYDFIEDSAEAAAIAEVMNERPGERCHWDNIEDAVKERVRQVRVSSVTRDRARRGVRRTEGR